MFNNDPIINEEELLSCIKEKCNKNNIDVDIEIIEKILNFEMDYLKEKGIVE